MEIAMYRPQQIVTTFTLVLLVAGNACASLLVDFNSTTQDLGPHNQSGYEAYSAAHEVSASFTTMIYNPAFAISGPASVSVTPAWPNTTDARVRQSIDRAAVFDANWLGNKLDLLTDWIGIDSRTGNGGNGNYDGTSGIPTYMTLTLAGLPAGTYDWLSYHHDTEHMWTPFQVEVSTDGWTTYGSILAGQMTDSTLVEILLHLLCMMAPPTDRSVICAGMRAALV